MRANALVLTVLLLTVALVSTAAAAPDPNPSVGQWINATFTLTYNSLTELNLGGAMDIMQYTDGTDVYSAKDVRNSFRGANRFGGATGDAFITNLESTLRTQIEDTLATAFPLAVSRTVNSVTVDRASLNAAEGADEFEPPVKLTISADILRSLDNLGLGTFSGAAVTAAFDAGAMVETTFSLTTNAGYETTYIITPPPGLAFASSSEAGAVSADGLKLTVVRDNTLGTESLRLPVTIRLVDKSANPPTAERVDSTIEISLGEIVSGSGGIPVTTVVGFDVYAISVRDRFPAALPASVILPFMSADGIRGLHQAGAISDEQITIAEESLRTSLRQNLTSSLGGETTVVGGFLPASLNAAPGTPYSNDASLRFEGNATGTRTFDSAASDNLDAAFDIGALIDFDIEFFSGTGDSTYIINAPPGVEFTEAPGGALANDGLSVTFTATAASGAVPGKIVMRDPEAPKYTASDAALDITVDLKDLDIALGKAIKGDLGEMVIEVTVIGNLAIIEVPADVQSALDERVTVNYLSSDALRLLRQRGLLSDADLAKVEANMLAQMAKGLTSALGQKVEVTGGFEAASLEAGLMSEPLSSDTPVVFRATANLRQSLNPDTNAQAAIALYTTTMPFTFPRVDGLDTVYTVILPKGLAVTNVETKGGTDTTGKSADGRDQFTVTPEDDNAKVTVSMAVTPTFIVTKFLGVILLVVLVLVLIIGTPIALVIRKRKNKA